MTKRAIQHFYRGKLFQRNTSLSDFIITGCSSGLTKEQCQDIFSKIWSSHSNQLTFTHLQPGFALNRYNDDLFVVTYVRPGERLERGYTYPHYHCWILPKQILITDLQGNLAPLISLSDQQPLIYEEEVPNYHFAPHIINAKKLSEGEELSLLNIFLQWLTTKPSDTTENNSDAEDETDTTIDDEEFSAEDETDTTIDDEKSELNEASKILRLISMILEDTSGLTKTTHIVKTDTVSTLDFFQSLLLLFPSQFRHRITFETETFKGLGNGSNVKFFSNTRTNKRLLKRKPRFNLADQWQKSKFAYYKNNKLHPYARFLGLYWTEDAKVIYDCIKQVDLELTPAIPYFSTLAEAEVLAYVVNNILISIPSLESTVTTTELSLLLTEAAWLSLERREYLNNLLYNRLKSVTDTSELFLWLRNKWKSADQENNITRLTISILKHYIDHYRTVAEDHDLFTRALSNNKLDPFEGIGFSLRLRSLALSFIKGTSLEYIIDQKVHNLGLLSCNLLYEYQYSSQELLQEIQSIFLPLATVFPSAAYWYFVFSQFSLAEIELEVIKNTPNLEYQIVFPIYNFPERMYQLNQNIYRDIATRLMYFLLSNEMKFKPDLYYPVLDKFFSERDLKKGRSLHDETFIDQWIDSITFSSDQILTDFYGYAVPLENQNDLIICWRLRIFLSIVQRDFTGAKFVNYKLFTEVFINELAKVAMRNNFARIQAQYIARVISRKHWFNSFDHSTKTLASLIRLYAAIKEYDGLLQIIYEYCSIYNGKEERSLIRLLRNDVIFEIESTDKKVKLKDAVKQYLFSPTIQEILINSIDKSE
jgi:hypothetical protein